MIKGITDKEYLIIKEILKGYPTDKFYAFGSRVKGDFSALSDLDVLVVSDNFEKIIARLKHDFDESYLPYVVNFTDCNSVEDSFYNIIKNDLTEL